MTANAHKECCHKLLLILVRQKGLHIVKTDCSDKIVIAFTIKEKLFIGKPIFRCGAVSFLFIIVILSC